MLVKLYISPSKPNVEVAGDIVLKTHVPYSDTTVTIQVNPSIEEFHEQLPKTGQPSVRNLMFSRNTNETRTLAFDLNGTRKHRTTVDSNQYEIELLAIEPLGQNQRAFEFRVEKI